MDLAFRKLFENWNWVATAVGVAIWNAAVNNFFDLFRLHVFLMQLFWPTNVVMYQFQAAHARSRCVARPIPRIDNKKNLNIE